MSITIQRSPYITDETYRKSVIADPSNHSYLTNRKITEIFNKDSWRDQPCFITAGGPSLANFDFSRLQGKLTIGINKSFLTYSPSILYGMDSTFYQQMVDGDFDKREGCRVFLKWLNCPSHKIFLTPLELKKYGVEVFLVRREKKIGVNREDLDRGIWGGQNSAVGAINLAISLGASPIYLLGYDMKCREKTHHHNGYVDMSADVNGQPKLVERDPIQFNRKLSE